MRQLIVVNKITPRESDAFEIYLSEIKREKLLSISEEVEIARKIHQGDFSALDKLVRCNLRFVVSVAKQYQNSCLTLSDLINEGNIGLIYAAKKFDETRGFRFISYAVWWIRQSIMLAINQQGKIVRVPQNQSANWFRAYKAINKFEHLHERQPSIDELAKETNLTETQLIDTFNYSRTKSISADKPFQDGEESCLLDVLVDYDSPSPDISLEKESLSISINDILSKVLNERENKIIRMSFGINEELKTLEEIGFHLALTRERVRQIREKSIKKLKGNAECKNLIGYLG